MSEVPTREELLRAARKACDDANLPWWDDEARAILDAVLPLVVGPAVEVLGPFHIAIELLECTTSHHYSDETPINDPLEGATELGIKGELTYGDFRLARTTHAGLKALGDAKRGES